MAKKVIVLLADGFEEVEAVTPIDYLRRAGVEVTTASVSLFMTVKGSRGIQVNANTELAGVGSGAGDWDAVVIPGGASGADNIASSEEACALLKNMAAAGKLVCAICASPAVVLAPLGLLSGKKFTCYPGLETRVTDGKFSDERVVVDGNIITSRSAGTAGEFSIAIIKELLDEASAKKIADSVLL